jgi:hypothetical protein
MRFPRNAHEPSPLGFGSDEIRHIGEHFANRRSIQPGASLTALVTELGGRIGNLMNGDIVDSDADSLIVYRDRSFLARIKEPTDPDQPKMRFELAILIGHYVMHLHRVHAKYGLECGMLVPFYAKTGPQLACQREAIDFAFGFLIPRDAFLACWAARHGSVAAVAGDFAVPQKYIETIRSAYVEPRLKAA